MVMLIVGLAWPTQLNGWLARFVPSGDRATGSIVDGREGREGWCSSLRSVQLHILEAGESKTHGDNIKGVLRRKCQPPHLGTVRQE